MESPCSGVPGRPGILGQGCTSISEARAGGGGGGYYGGGAGWISGGGGGGSSFSLYPVVEQGYNLGDGYAVIEWDWVGPSNAPTAKPSAPTRKPTVAPTFAITVVPTTRPTPLPSALAVSPHILRFTGLEQNFLVPENVASLTVTLYGGSGDKATNSYGRGAMLSAVVPVIAGEVLSVNVGSAAVWNKGGGNGGGNSLYSGRGGGGGATDIRKSPHTMQSRILIAGGGGGGGGGASGSVSDCFGGDGGVEATA